MGPNKYYEDFGRLTSANSQSVAARNLVSQREVAGAFEEVRLITVAELQVILLFPLVWATLRDHEHVVEAGDAQPVWPR